MHEECSTLAQGYPLSQQYCQVNPRPTENERLKIIKFVGLTPGGRHRGDAGAASAVSLAHTRRVVAVSSFIGAAR
jgi:hypothetical protein